jgi:hypothetical protein
MLGLSTLTGKDKTRTIEQLGLLQGCLMEGGKKRLARLSGIR